MFATFKKLGGDGTIEEQWHAIVHHPDEHIQKAALLAMQEYEDALEDPYLESRTPEDPFETELRDHIGKEKNFLYVGHFIPSWDSKGTAMAQRKSDEQWIMIDRLGEQVSTRDWAGIQEVEVNAHICFEPDYATLHIYRPDGTLIATVGGIMPNLPCSDAIGVIHEGQRGYLRLSDGEIIGKGFLEYGEMRNGFAPVKLARGSWKYLCLNDGTLSEETYQSAYPYRDGWAVTLNESGAATLRDVAGNTTSNVFDFYPEDNDHPTIVTEPKNGKAIFYDSIWFSILPCSVGAQDTNLGKTNFNPEQMEDYYSIGRWNDEFYVRTNSKILIFDLAENSLTREIPISEDANIVDVKLLGPGIFFIETTDDGKFIPYPGEESRKLYVADAKAVNNQLIATKNTSDKWSYLDHTLRPIKTDLAHLEEFTFGTSFFSKTGTDGHYMNEKGETLFASHS